MAILVVRSVKEAPYARKLNNCFDVVIFISGGLFLLLHSCISCDR